MYDARPDTTGGFTLPSVGVWNWGSVTLDISRPTTMTIYPLVFPVWSHHYTLDSWPWKQVSRGVRGQTVYLMRGSDCRVGGTSQADTGKGKKKPPGSSFLAWFQAFFIVISYFLLALASVMSETWTSNLRHRQPVSTRRSWSSCRAAHVGWFWICALKNMTRCIQGPCASGWCVIMSGFGRKKSLYIRCEE